MVTDEFETDVASLVPMNLAPEPVQKPDASHPDNEAGENVEAPEADLSGEPIVDVDPFTVDSAVDFDEAADRALLEEGD